MLLSLFAFIPLLAVAVYVVPLPNGPYGVSIQDALLTDYDLQDPYLNLTYRRVPISIIAPTGSSADCEPVIQPYMPDATANFWEEEFLEDYGLQLNNTISQTELILCKAQPLNKSTPVVLFAPGASVSRYLYNILASAIVAQTGHTIVTYDIPGQSGIVQFPDGSTQYQASATASATFTNEHAIAVVLEDGIVVLDAVYPRPDRPVNITSDPPLPQTLTNTSQAAMIGHSQGGAAALVGLLVDERFAAGSNMDGGLNATADNIAVCSNSQTNLNCSTSTTDRPFMIVEHQGSNQSTADGWTDVWNNVLQGSKWQTQLNGTMHGAFGDFPYLMDLYGIREKKNLTKLVDIAVGTLPGAVVMEVLPLLFKAFLGYGFQGTQQATADNVTAVAVELELLGLEVVNQTVVT